VNNFVNQGQRIVLPRLSDVVSDGLGLLALCERGDEVELCIIDFQDALHSIPINQGEKRFQCVSFNGQFYAFEVLVFGSGSAPTIWGRTAAWLGRSTQALVPASSLRLQVFVDDPLFLVRGTAPRRRLELATAIAWISAIGFPLAWAKAARGPSVVWIGASLSISQTELEVSIPARKINEVLQIIEGALAKHVVPVKIIQSLAGKVSFMAGLVIDLRPFIAPLWAALADAQFPRTGEALGPSQMAGTKRKTPRHLLHVKRFRKGLKWVKAFLLRQVGAICRTYSVSPTPGEYLTVAVDASPWGMGGVLFDSQYDPKSWFATSITPEDTHRLQAIPGVCDYNTLWEALAILIALRLWGGWY